MRVVPERAYRWARMRSRLHKANALTSFMRSKRIRSVLFVGAGQGWEPLDLVVESAAADVASFAIACDLHTDHNLPWPYVRADGRALPFPDDSFDLVVSNAVIEHVGDLADQRRFVAEHLRVGRHFCITTPNRWFPFEPHEKVAFLHWFPAWRQRQDSFTRLLSGRELKALLPAGSRTLGRFWSPTYISFWSKPEP